MQCITNLMMVLLRSEITGTELDKSLFVDLTEEDWTRLYYISKLHDLAHLVGDAVLKYELLVDGEIKEKFEKQLMTAVYRYQKIQYELSSIISILSEAQIVFLPLKGSVIRQYYPEPWMRTSCDIDILVSRDDVEEAKCYLTEKLKYTFENTGEHDISGHSQSGVHLELHFQLNDESANRKWEALLMDVWDYSKKTENEYHRLLSPEMFYYYHIAHMAKHYENGGCGIRPFIDLWLLNQQSMNQTEIRELLEKGGLTTFSRAVTSLANVWFGGEEMTEQSCQIENYVLHGGVYGTRDNQITVSQVHKGGKVQHIISRIWVPYAYLCTLYPSLRGKRIFQPFYEIRRWFRLFKKDTFKRSREELKTSTAVSKEQTKQTTQMLSDLGLL